MTENFICEEIFEDDFDCDGDDSDGDVSDVDKNVTINKTDLISEEDADMLYMMAGEPFSGASNQELTVLPQPLVMADAAEILILDAQETLGLQHTLDQFQIQPLIGMSSNKYKYIENR